MTTIKTRRVTHSQGLDFASFDQNILIVDSACDQSIINSSFQLLSRSGLYYSLEGALQDRMKCETALEIVDGATKVTDKRGASFLLVVNQALYDDHKDQKESLLQPHQARAHGVAVDDCSRLHRGVDGEPGSQCIQAGQHRVPLLYDGWKCYLAVSKPTMQEIRELPRIELTSPHPYEPTKRFHTRRMHSKKRQKERKKLEEWRTKLGYPPMDVVKKTLSNTTQMVKTVEAETREYMRDHYKARLLPLRPFRINDTCFSDTFFSSITSVRGYTMFQLFAFKYSQFDVPYLMKKKAQANARFRDLVREVGAPNIMVTDGAKEMTGEDWLNTCRQFCISSHMSEAYHQNSSLAERRGGDLKTALIKMFHLTPQAPLAFWCYGMEYLALVRGCLARQNLDWRCPEEIVFGETVDISVYRFPWFSAIWYYEPNKFPSSKMKAGTFLGVAPTVGDGFSYIIVSEEELTRYRRYPRTNPITLIRSVVRRRSLEDDEAPICTRSEETDELKFHNKDGKELQGDFELIELDTVEQLPEKLPPSSGIDDLPELPTQPVQQRQGTQTRQPFMFERTDLDEEDLNYISDEYDSEEEDLEEQHPNPTQILNVDKSVTLESNKDELYSLFDSTDNPVNSPFNNDHTTNIDADDDMSVTSNVSEDNAEHVNSHFAREESDDKDEYHAIRSHRWIEGILELEVEYCTGETEFLPYDLVRDEDPHATATYIISMNIESDSSSARYYRWARRFLRDIKRTIRRLYRINHQYFGAPDEQSSTASSSATKKVQGNRRVNRKKKTKPGRNNRPHVTTKYGVEVPKNWADVKCLDKHNNNRLWQDAVEKEMASLIHHDCFEFKPPGHKLPSDYQTAPLRMVYEVKNDLRRKARLVVQGFKVDPGKLSTRATVVKGVSVRLLDLIAHRDNLTVLAGDIGNAFIQARTKEKCYTVCGPEFGAREGSIAIIVRALYGLTTSAERWRTLFADFLRSLGFVSTRYDRDVWMRLREDKTGYDYICTHVDDFKIIARDPNKWMEMIKQTFLVKQAGPPDYYLGNNYRYEDNENIWTVGTVTYLNEAVRKVEEIFGTLRMYKTPLPADNFHPEMDDSPLLNEKQHRQYQMLIGMLNWLVTIGRPDLCFAASSLGRFGACPRENHLRAALQVFGYMKKYPDKRIAVDSSDIDFSKYTVAKELKADFCKEYNGISEDMDPGFPKAYGEPLQTSIFCDADHAHDKKTRRSITGIIGFVGSTPVLWSSRRQGAIAASTYAAEFMALRTATEEAMSLRYMLRCLGVPIANDGTMPTRIFGDNLSVIQNATNVELDLSKKHVAISFHVVREAIAAGITAPFWVQGEYNLSDILTKQIPSIAFHQHTDNTFWRPKHRK